MIADTPNDARQNADTKGAGNQDEDPKDRSPARQKDQQRDEPKGSTHAPSGTDEIGGADADEDTYD